MLQGKKAAQKPVVFLMLGRQKLLHPVTVLKFQKRKNRQKRLIIKGNSVTSFKGVSGAPKPTRHPFVKRITKDTDNEAAMHRK